MPNEKKLTASDIIKRFKAAYEAKSKLLVVQKEDIEYALGKQWPQEDIDTLWGKGIRALTINLIAPIIRMLKGIVSQSKTDYKAYPIGKEDNIKSEIATALLKHAIDQSDYEYKSTEQFELSSICGEAYLEPYFDYEDNIFTPTLRYRLIDSNQIFPSPEGREYDLSDRKYIIKITRNLSYDDLLMLFPDEERKIKRIGKRNIDLTKLDELMQPVVHIEPETRYQLDNEHDEQIPDWEEEATGDLIEYYYKKIVEKSLVIDYKLKRLIDYEDEGKSREYINIANTQEPRSADVVSRKVNEIWRISVVGNEIIKEERISNARWNKYPFIPLYAYKYNAKVDNKELLIQGIARGLKDLNIDYNKRRTNELQHINQSTNSGFQVEEGQLEPEELNKLEKYGATPGIIIKRKKGTPPIERFMPVPLSQAHAQISEERKQEIREVSGINTDMLAMSETQASGRAISLRQRQGLVMVQGLFDNLSRTREINGKYVLSILGKIYDVEGAMKVLGDKYLKDTFGMPAMTIDPATGQPVPVMENGKLRIEMSPEAVEVAKSAFNEILNSKEVLKYDVVLGESIYSDTIQLANFTTILDMLKSGAPIPAEVVIEESGLSEDSKRKSLEAIARAKEQAAQMPPGGNA